jgi:hypothetical protein
MKKHLIISLFIVGLLGSSLVHAQANPASAACQKLKKEGLADELKRKKLFKAYSPSMGKPMSTFTAKQFDAAYAGFVSLVDFNLVAFEKLKKAPECFSKEQFKMIENSITMYGSFNRVATKKFIQAQPKPFLKIAWESIYGTKL